MTDARLVGAWHPGDRDGVVDAEGLPLAGSPRPRTSPAAAPRAESYIQTVSVGADGPGLGVLSGLRVQRHVEEGDEDPEPGTPAAALAILPPVSRPPRAPAR